MGFFRNPEIQRGCVFYLIGNLAVLLLGALQGAIGLALVACFLLDGLYLFLTWRRYRVILQMADEIDQTLHGSGRVNLIKYQEGELAILENELEKMTERLYEQAASLQKDRAYLKDSIADISHQLKTPMTSIHLIASFLNRPELPQERRRQLAQELEQLSRRIDWLVSALLMLSKLDAGVVQFQQEPINVVQAIQKAVEPLEIPMDLRGQSFFVESSGVEQVTGDFAWLVEAIGNILKNATEHTPEGGKIWVSVSENQLYTELIFRDSGGGIAPEDLPYVFQRFYKGKHSGEQSAGIGLALARQIVTAQGGTLKAENSPQGGAKFSMRFYKQTI